MTIIERGLCVLISGCREGSVKIVETMSCANGNFETMVIIISYLGGSSIKVSVK